MILIYAIICDLNNFAYVGCTKGKLAKRMREHRCLLRKGEHTCKLLQEDWKKYGESHFKIFEVDSLLFDESIESKRKLELKWLRFFKDEDRLYNEHLISFSPCEEAWKKGVKNAHKTAGNRWTPEVNERRRLAQLGKPKKHGAKISATKKAKQMMI